VLVSGDHLSRGQVTARECRRSGMLVPALHAGFPLRLLLPLPGSTRIGGENRPAGRRSHLRGGLPRRSNQDVSFHVGRVVIAEPGRLVGNNGHPGQIDHPGSQRSGGQGQPPQRDRQVQDAPSAATGQP
jgi:hypothetical protein